MTTTETTPSKTFFNWEAFWVLIGTPILICIVWWKTLLDVDYTIGALAAGILWFFLLNAGIGVGYHRGWTHGAATFKPSISWILAFFSAAAMQGPFIIWGSHHKKHHAHTEDPEKDPHGGRGLFWSHIWWMIRDNPKTAPSLSIIKMHKREPALAFQAKYYREIAYGINTIGLYLLAMLLSWSVDFWTVLPYFMSMQIARVIQQQATACVNSVCHKWGKRPFTRANMSTDNEFVRLLTGGEGGHNFHHAFPSDYRNSWRWWHYDPHKWIIWALVQLRLAHFTPNAMTSTERIQMAIADVLEQEKQAASAA